ncbi:GNAT family N-acetyltransferase [Rhodococcus sp. WMMA185]|nr:GNAT family N-acetyltransferase [Rhodococcus sp. WMMA185]
MVVELSAAEFRDRLQEALSVYVAAMGYPQGTEYHRAATWSEHLRRSGWRAVAAFVPAGDSSSEEAPARLVAIAYGYRGAPGQWWHQQVRSGLRHTGWSRDRIDILLGNYFELTELHVHPDVQGQQIGETLLLRLLEHRPEEGVLLSTPEVADEDNRAWRLYRRLGFKDVLRHFRFGGDNRPFAVLGRGLPL